MVHLSSSVRHRKPSELVLTGMIQPCTEDRRYDLVEKAAGSECPVGLDSGAIQSIHIPAVSEPVFTVRLALIHHPRLCLRELESSPI